MDEQKLSVGDCTFDLATLTLRSATGARVTLRTQSIRVLAELARSHGEVVSRDALSQTVWQGIIVTDDSIAQCIKDIRAVLSDHQHQIVKTVVGQGYTLIARTMPAGMSDRPKIFIDRFRATGGSDEAVELTEALFEELVIRLTSRVGVTVITKAAHRAEARFVIGGRATARGHAVRVFVKIERVDTGKEVFAITEETLDSDVWTLAALMAERVVAHLRVHLIVNDGLEMANHDNSELPVQDLMNKAGWQMLRPRRANWIEARSALVSAVSLEPENPIALAMLASMHTHMIPLIPFSELPDDFDNALALSERAVEVGQNIDYVLRTRANLRLWRLVDHDGARLDCKRAFEINPGYHLAHLTMATSEIFSGEFQAGEKRLQEIMQRVPDDPQNPLYFSLIALARLLDGRMNHAVAAAREGYDLSPLSDWNALVYATTVGAEPAPRTEAFNSMVASIKLSANHFRDFPITNIKHIDALVDWAKNAGVPT